MNKGIVVSDAGPLIALASCGHLNLLLDVYDSIHIPRAVLNETIINQCQKGASEITAFALTSATLYHDRDDDVYRSMSNLDEGEAQAISLANVLGRSLLIDERRGRRIAISKGIPISGVLGVLVKAKQLEKIDLIAPIVSEMRANGYYLADQLISKVLEIVGET